jgi:uncharacterized protein YbjT (DUF2867 family)
MSSEVGKEIVIVFGATGKQGGAVVRELLKEDKFKVRAVTRHRDERKVVQLKEMGVEVMDANIGTGAGLDEALKGVYAAFLITPSFDKEIEGQEFECGKRLVDKAKAKGVRVLIWSSAPNVNRISGGTNLDIPQFLQKAKVEEYIRNMQMKDNAFESAMFIIPSFYYQNFQWKAFSPKKDESGTFVFKFPSVRNLIACDVNDLGDISLMLLSDPKSYNLKKIFLDGEQGDINHYVQLFGKITGRKAVLQTVSFEEFEKCPEIHHSRQIAHMLAFLDEYPTLEKTPDVIHSRQIYPKTKSFEEWLRVTGWKGEQVTTP